MRRRGEGEGAGGRLSLVCSTHGDIARENDLVQLMREQHAAAVGLVGGVVPDDAYQRRMTEYARALDAAGSRLVLVGPLRPPGCPRRSWSTTTGAARSRRRPTS